MSSTLAQVNSQSSFEKRPVRSLVFIDSGVEDYESIAAGVLPGQQVVILNKVADFTRPRSRHQRVRVRCSRR
jgi:hypothetical protein